MSLTPNRLIRALYHRLVLAPLGAGKPVPAEAFDREFASGAWDHFDSLDELPRYLILAGVVRHFYSKPALLEVGCGSGLLAKLLTERPVERYLGIDKSEEGLRRARALGLAGCEFEHGDFESWTSDKTFDAVVFNESIGYAADPGRTVAWFATRLNREGRIFISLYRSGNSNAIWRRVERSLTVEFATQVRHSNGKAWDIKVLRAAEGSRP